MVDTRDLKSLGRNCCPGSSPGFGTLCVRSHAKINLYLRVVGKRPDGYHEIQTVYQGISLYDTLWITPSIRYKLNIDKNSNPKFIEQIPLCEKNLITRAYLSLRERVSIPVVEVDLEKQIPIKGGLGGASSNAAGLLLGISAMCGGIDFEILDQIARELGSDVPFFLRKGIFSGTSRGEKLEYLGAGPKWSGILVYPGEGISTKDAYDRWEAKENKRTFDEIKRYLAECREGRVSLKSFCTLVYNSFQESDKNGGFVTRGMFERLENVETVVPLLCGTGSCVVIFYEAPSLAEVFLSELNFPGCEFWKIEPEENPVKTSTTNERKEHVGYQGRNDTKNGS